MDEDKLTLRVGGQIYGGWKQVLIQTGIGQLAGAYELGITERWPAQTTDWEIPPGEYCEVEIGEDVVISGYVDKTAVTYDANSHEIKISGRDRAGDLVDCSAPSKSYKGLTLEQIAKTLCEPYGISVYDETRYGRKLTEKEKADGKKTSPPSKPRIAKAVPKQANQTSESVFRTLDKIARSEGVLLVSDGEGGLLITRAGMGGDCEVTLELGKNIKSASYENSFADLYSEITVKGQSSAVGASRYDLSNAAPKGTVKRAKSAKSGNSQIDRYRPLILIAETQANAARCQQRAAWEASNREAKSRKITIAVQGWREKPDGDLWRINKMVKIKCPWMRLDESWLISGVTYKIDDGGGTVTDLTLVDKRSFDLLPEIPKPKGGGSTDGKYKVV